MKDMVAKGRSRGRFTPAQVATMRQLHASGTSQAAIAKQFGTNQSHISRIIRHEVYNHNE
jgi:DNA invertase Pin-like site-specific DNA recombinase